MLRKFVIVLSGFGPLAALGAQPQLQKTASDAWNARDWNAAANAYETIVRTDTTAALPYIRLGVALTELGRYDEARKQIAVAERKGAPVLQTAFRLALIEAASGKIDEAFVELKRATDAGLPLIPIPGDSLRPMQKIKADARFAKFLTDIDRNARPCMYDAKFKEFDFWVGTWDVRPRLAPTNPPARSEITKIDDGCVVHESWKAPASVGQSFNIWDRTREKWFQIWVDNSGGLHEYSGTYSDNAMRYEGTTPALPPASGRVKTRLTFFKIAADTVRQLSESEGQDGKWSVNYDFIYTRRKN
ncbi:MAG TPA: tetratricopeptide repeat protein [Gemmatimonadaceae bacterium]